MEVSTMAARHFDDIIGALGASGYLQEAVWRINTVYSHLTKKSQEDDFFQVVANLDYAWMWAGKNVYGLLEFYYNGLGRLDDYGQAFENDAIMDRILRGEMFTVGRFYLAGQMQVELHPLVQWHTTAISTCPIPPGFSSPRYFGMQPTIYSSSSASSGIGETPARSLAVSMSTPTVWSSKQPQMIRRTFG